MNTKSIILSTVAVVALSATGAIAQVNTTANTDLNIRSGPGPMYQIVGVIPAEASADVSGCITSGDWCAVTYDGVTGWSYAAYLSVEDNQTPLSEAASTGSVSVIEFDNQAEEATLVGAGMGAAMGAIVAGPVGAIVGAFVTGTAAGMSADNQVVVYAMENPVDPIILNGEVVTGAFIPDDVTVYELPENAQYAYLNVNGNTVIVDAETREIVHILR